MEHKSRWRSNVTTPVKHVEWSEAASWLGHPWVSLVARRAWDSCLYRDRESRRLEPVCPADGERDGPTWLWDTQVPRRAVADWERSAAWERASVQPVRFPSKADRLPSPCAQPSCHPRS